MTVADLDRDTAWRHLLSLEPGTTGRAGPLRLEPDGSWWSAVEADPSAATLLDIFAPLRVKRRFVVGQLGQSLDGRIATEAGHSHYINGPEDLTRLHGLRALAQAVVVGAGTVASDDPRLTVRRLEGPDPVRVVLDPSGRLDPGRTIFTDGAAPTLWVQAGPEVLARPSRESEGSDDSPRAAHDAERLSASVEIVRIPTSDSAFDPRAVLAMLEERGLVRVLVEGGGHTVSGFLAAGALHRLHVSVAPLLMGSGRPSITLPPIETLDEAIRPPTRHFRLGDDLLFELELKSFEV